MSDPAAASAALPEAEIVHRIPNRIRLRLISCRGDEAFFRRVKQGLTELPGVRSVQANARTASLLIGHDGDETALLAAARDQDLFTAAPPAQTAPVLRPSRRPATANMIPSSPLNVAALGLAGAGVLQLARGEVVGSASENLWNAYGLYAVTQQRWPLAFLIPFGLLQIVRGEILGSATSLFLYAFSAWRMAERRPMEPGA